MKIAFPVIFLAVTLAAMPIQAKTSPSGPAYRAALSRVYSVGLVHKLIYLHCISRLPEGSGFDRNLYPEWSARNRIVLAEVSLHFDAMMANSAKESQSFAAVASGDIDTLRDVLLKPTFTLIDSGPIDEAKRLCVTLSNRLGRSDSLLEVEYVTQLSKIRTCVVDNTCPGMKTE